MNFQLVMILGGLAAVYMTSKSKTPPSAQPPAASANAVTQKSGQPGIQNYLSQILSGIGLGNNVGTAQTTNQSQYGGNKAFMGTPATPVSTQIVNAAANVNWGAVGTTAASVWNNLFGNQSSTAATDASVSPSSNGTVMNDVADPQPNLEFAMDGADTVDASSAWDNAPSSPDYTDYQTYDA